MIFENEDIISSKTHDGMKAEYQLGFYSSIVSFVAAVGYCFTQLLQVTGLIKFPIDAVLIYGFSLGIAAPYMVTTIAVRQLLSRKKRIRIDLAIAFALMYAVYVNLNYVVQLATVIPASINGSLQEVQILDQTPHSLFWDIDALGYICFGISTFFLGLAFSKHEKWLKGFLFSNGLMVPVISFIYFYPHFSVALLLIGLPWGITAPGSLFLLAIFFQSKIKRS